MKKKLSNPFSTGGGGSHFESHVQASFVTLMLTGGNSPCLPCWPIIKIKLQGKVDGFDTDDLIIEIENPANKKRLKLLGQIKHSVNITASSPIFREVIQAAWNDFNNADTFSKDNDVIALITGPLSQTDTEVAWILNHARSNRSDPQRFFRNIATANFSSSVKRKKLKVIRDHLKSANKGVDLTNETFHKFLTNFYLLGYDLDEEEGVVLSLLNSHISQFKPESSRFVWGRILEFTNNRNHHAGCITPKDLPEDLVSIFSIKHIVEFPNHLGSPHICSPDWAHHPDASYLAQAILIGSWQDKNKHDMDVLSQLLGLNHEECLAKTRKMLLSGDAPLTIKNGKWNITNRSELWQLLGPTILDQDLDKFKSLAVSVLKEPDPAFELPPDERYAASVHGKVLKYSLALRQGITEGLAILGNSPNACHHCSQGKAETICALVTHELLNNADWILWGSLNNLLPTLAESAPREFLDSLDEAMLLNPCPFDKLFSQEGNGITDGCYLTGLLWALEGLAWDEQYLVRVCMVLGELASHDPGGRWSNRPSNSLATILLPWLPQTLASVEKRKVAVNAILKEWPDIAWQLILQLLPGQYQTSSGSHKPQWRKIIPDDWKKGVTHQEYWEQVAFYGELAVTAAGQDTARLSTLIDHFDSLTQPAFDQLLQVLASQNISEIPEEKRLSLWNHLKKFTSKHRRFSESKWALSGDLISRIEEVSKKIAPKNPFNLHQNLFSDHDVYSGDEKESWEERQKKLNAQRKAAIHEIFHLNGIDGVIQFAESVASPFEVGHALSEIIDPTIEKALIPQLLDPPDSKHKALVSGFIWWRHHLNGWEWSDKIDKSKWSPKQVGQFLAYLPFTKDAWDRASKWLKARESEYWSRTEANIYEAKENLSIAIEKLIDHGRPYAAINCLQIMLYSKCLTDTGQCARALIAALSSNEPNQNIDGYHIAELIKFLQTNPLTSQDDLFKVEWAYIPLLDGYSGTTPQYLERRLANDPDFFCEIIQLIYRSTKEIQPPKESTEELKAIATNAWRLLDEWKIPPGTQTDGTFNDEHFTKWLHKVKVSCTESGHLDVALINIGEVLIHTPPDPNGLWIRTVVADALNARDTANMREGFNTGIYNSRGVHCVDPTGTPEKKLAEKFRKKAEEVENAGFLRFSVSLKNLADGYEREAERIICNYKE